MFNVGFNQYRNWISRIQTMPLVFRFLKPNVSLLFIFLTFFNFGEKLFWAAMWNREFVLLTIDIYLQISSVHFVLNKTDSLAYLRRSFNVFKYFISFISFFLSFLIDCKKFVVTNKSDKILQVQTFIRFPQFKFNDFASRVTNSWLNRLDFRLCWRIKVESIFTLHSVRLDPWYRT